MRPLAIGLVVIGVVGLGTASAQQPSVTAKKSFEVASVRIAAPLDPQQLMSGNQRVGMKVDAGRVDIENWSIFELLNAAFKVALGRLTGPAWGGFNALTAQRYDIHATIPPGATKDDVPEMLASLLADRWKLAYHTETREQDVYAMVVGRDGPKLTPSPQDAPPSPEADGNRTNRPDPVSISGDPQKGMTIRGAGPAGALRMTVNSDGGMRMENDKLTMTQLADSLSQLVGKRVVDQTGLTGNYRVAIELTREDLMAAARAAGLNVGLPGPSAGASDPGGGASIFRSVESMGLKFESKRLPVEYFVIDKLEKVPTEN